jgi:hypothetical protein
MLKPSFCIRKGLRHVHTGIQTTALSRFACLLLHALAFSGPKDPLTEPIFLENLNITTVYTLL